MPKPKTKDYERAFGVFMAGPWRRELVVLMKTAALAPGYSREDQAKEAGYPGGYVVNLRLGLFARKIASELNISQPPQYYGEDYWMLVFEHDPIGRNAAGHTVYMLRDQVCKALLDLDVGI